MTRVGLLGSSSLVARTLLDASAENDDYVPFSRADTRGEPKGHIPYWISLVPIWALSELFPLIESHGGERIVALSSTSVFTKISSADNAERRMVEKMLDGEARLAEWASARSIRYTILRPTMIYGRGLDRNVCMIASMIRRFGFFPLFGAANGLRQPVHVDDVALACRRALELGGAPAYNFSGGEEITYRDMVVRIFERLDKTPRLVNVPLWIFQASTPAIRLIPKFHDWSPSMARRMNEDLVFDNSRATADLGIAFRRFEPTLDDLIPKK